MSNAKLTQYDLQAIKERAEKAPAGPWTFGEGYEQMEPGYYFADVKGYITLADEEGTVKPETIDFIINAQQDVTKLLAEVERLQRLLEQATPALFGFWAEEQQKNADLSAEIERLQAEVHEHSAHNGQLIATHVIPTKEENKRLKAEVERLTSVIWRMSSYCDLSTEETRRFINGGDED